MQAETDQGPVWKSHAIYPYPGRPNALQYSTTFLVAFFVCSENTYILALLTHFEPTMRISDGQIPPDSMTHPCQIQLVIRKDLTEF